MRIYRFFLVLFLSLGALGCLKAQSLSNLKIGVDLGYGINGHVPIGINVEYNRMIFGITANMAVSKGVEGEKYTGTVNWDQFSEDHISEGSFKQSFVFEVGYFLTTDFALGAGIGYAATTHYRNCYDEFHILGNNGSYYKEINTDSNADLKIFALYKFPTEKNYKFYLKGGYDIVTSAFLSVGVQF